MTINISIHDWLIMFEKIFMLHLSVQRVILHILLHACLLKKNEKFSAFSN